MLTRKRTIAAVHFTDVMRTAIVTVGNKITIDCIGEQEIYDPIFTTSTPDSVQFLLSENYAFSFVREQLTPQSIEVEKRKLGVTEDHVFDYFDINGKSIFAYCDKGAVDRLKGMTLTNYGVMQENLALIYYFLRYDSFNAESRTAIINVGPNYVSLIALHSNVPRLIYTRPCPTKSVEDRLSSISLIIKNVLEGAGERSGLGWQFFTKILLFGADDIVVKNKLLEFTNVVEVPNIFASKQIDSSAIKSSTVFRNIETNLIGNLFTIPVACALMAHEGIGINLADTTIKLDKQFPAESQLYSEPSELGKAIDAVNGFIPKLVAQKYVVLCVLLIVAGLFGFRFYRSNSESRRLAADLAAEQARAASLIDIKEKNELYKARIAELTQRISAIEQIQADQLLAKTVLDSVDENLPRDVNLSELVVDRVNVKLSGYALDRTQVLQLASRVGSNGRFGEVVPVYADPKGSQTSSFTITCRYTGTVPKPEYVGY